MLVLFVLAFQSALEGCFLFPNGRPEFHDGKKRIEKRLVMTRGTIADS